MRKKGIKWVIGTLSLVAVVFAVVMVSSSTHAQDDESSDNIKIENSQDTPSAELDANHSLMMEEMDCSKGCDPNECEAECTEECASFCKSKQDKIEKGDC